MVSIVVPVYNVEKYLSMCINSILKQTYTNFELIIVDDGSTDKSSEICDVYSEKDARIKVFHKKNGGLSSARNMGIENANGEYIMFVDSDDYIHHQMVEKMLRDLKKNDADVCMCGVHLVSEEFNDEIPCGTTVNRVISREKAISNIYTRAEYVISCNKLFKKTLFTSVRYPVGKYNEDEAVILPILYQTNQAVLMREKLYYYRQRSDSIMGSGRGEYNEYIYQVYRDRMLFFVKHNMRAMEYKNARYVVRKCCLALDGRNKIDKKFRKKLCSELLFYIKNYYYLFSNVELCKLLCRVCFPTLYSRMKGVYHT